ncbi:hypothetical protein QJ854_gp244 [Moumouvirus goulette]|uniref:Uncharacterized protein n=1 Tax=Moumouvirus goulette TaxID=1247379 RepID=M1PHI0_9VIRU|nr:hypothetical protein QJ854_gp244 [Moumouvirus goulette]AGF85538.1 hypothetical protein glt_00733 [Moumouvirus goulette]
MNSFTCTENGDKAFLTSGNVCLDFFTRITRGAPIQDYIKTFCACWKEDSEIAIRLLLNLRDIRSGKGEKLIPIAIILYLKLNIETSVYESILHEYIKYGCWKDLLKIIEIDSYISSEYKISTSTGIEVKLFSEQLKEDINLLKSSQQDKKSAISLCAKWAPSEYSHYNKKSLSVANDIMYSLGMKPKEYRKMLTNLREHLIILENLMSTQQFDKIDFSKLPSVAIKKMNNAFIRDSNSNGKFSDARLQLKNNYQKYLSLLQKGETKVNVKGIHPHELVHEYLSSHKETDTLIEAQWNTIRQQVLSSGAFNNVTAVVDVSGSMAGQPMDVSIALGILVSECTQGPYHGQVITFHEKPSWHILTGSSLRDQVKSLIKAKWGGNTNMKSVFDLILKKAIDAKLKPNEMIKTLFIFTDMQFDNCSNDPWMTTFEYAKKQFNDHGYQIPNIVCWNLRTSSNKTLPVQHNEQGYAMLSGFSPELLKCIMNAENYNPFSIMMKVLEPYNVSDNIKTCLTKNIDQEDNKFYDNFSNALAKSLFVKSYKKNNN